MAKIEPQNNVNQIVVTSADDIVKEINKIDFAVFQGLARSDFIEKEIKTMIGVIEQKNNAIERLDKVLAKINITENGPANYTDVTWRKTENNVRLSNGYNLDFDTSSGLQFALTDKYNNQIFFKDGVLIPASMGTTSDVLKAGIPIMSDTSLALGDGTTITFTTEPKTDSNKFNQDDLSGGIAKVSAITIRRGNQSMKIDITPGDNQQITIGEPVLNTAHPNLNYGHVLLENDGLASWEYNGKLVSDISYKDGNNEEIDSFFARKIHFQNSVTDTTSYTKSTPVLTVDDKLFLTQIDVKFTDSSGSGRLSSAEATALKSNINDKKSSLGNSTHLDYVKLQKANSNFSINNEFLISFISRIFDVLKQIGRM